MQKLLDNPVLGLFIYLLYIAYDNEWSYTSRMQSL